MLRLRAWLVVLGACGFTHGSAARDDGGSSGGETPIMDVNMPDARACFGSGLITVCLTAPPPADFTVATPTSFDTDGNGCTRVVAQSAGPGLCVVEAQTIHITAPFTAVNGDRALVLLATDTLDISGTGVLDVSSHLFASGPTITSQQIGAGEATGAALCGTPTGGGADNSGSGASGGGGGAGGSFGGSGGNGAQGRNGGGGTAGTAVAGIGVTTIIRGGCPGTPGGSGEGNNGGAPGHGGGAAYLIAGSQITIAGMVNAGGQGGRGGSSLAGGGGGGSGGFIGLDAPVVTVTGVVMANGAGGGEGGGDMGTADYGSSALSTTTVAAGGSGGSTAGGDGGNGGFNATANAGGGTGAANGAGAGGGSVGVIRVFPPQTLGGSVMPPAT